MYNKGSEKSQRCKNGVTLSHSSISIRSQKDAFHGLFLLLPACLLRFQLTTKKPTRKLMFSTGKYAISKAAFAFRSPEGGLLHPDL